MRNHTLTILAVAGGLAIVTFTLFYFFRGNKEHELISAQEPIPNLPKNLEPERVQPSKKNLAKPTFKATLPNANLGARPSTGMPMLPPATPPADAPTDSNKAEQDRYRDQAIETHIDFMYEDLFKDLSLDDNQRNKLTKELGQVMKKEAELAPSILDPNVPVEEIMKKQALLKETKIGDYLSADDQQAVKEFHDDLPKHMQKRQLNELVDQLGFQDSEHVKRAVEQAIERTDTQKPIGQMTEQDIIDLRQRFAGKKPGDADFAKASLEMAQSEVNNLLKNLEGLPREDYEKLREPIEAPLKMMQQQLKMQQQQRAGGQPRP